MKHTFIFKKAIIWAGMIFLAAMIFSPQKIYAECTSGEVNGPTTTPPTAYCLTNPADGTSVGIAVYSCAYYVELGGAWGCYWHYYACDTSCDTGGATPEPSECNWDCGGDAVCLASCGDAPSASITCGPGLVPCCTWVCPSPSCDATAPTNLSASRISPTKANITWTKGTNGTKQMLFVGANLNEIKNNCPGTASPACVVIEKNLSKTLNQYITGDVLSAGTVYFVKVVNYKDSSCEKAKRISYLTSCELSPSSLVLKIGDKQTVISNIFSSSEISKVDFIRRDLKQITVYPICNVNCICIGTNPPEFGCWQNSCIKMGNVCYATPRGFLQSIAPVVSLDPVSGTDTSYVYQTIATAIKVTQTGETHELISNVYFGANLECSNTIKVTVTAPGPWWQVKDSDVTTNGDIVSRIYPAGTKFILDGLGGYPGVAVYGAQAVFGNGTVSSKGWLANTTSTWLTSKTYDYNYFKNLVPGTWWDNKTETDLEITDPTYFVTTGTALDEYKLFYRSGNLTISAAQDVSNQKVLLFVDGDLTINNNISLTDGSGFFMAVVKGNIVINPAVTSLEGFYLADNEFITGTGSVPLTVRGSVTGLDGVSMQRNLGAGNTTNPAEVFEYAPDLIFTYPAKLTVRKMRWKEVAP